jgi:serine/threonine-protein kinase
VFSYIYGRFVLVLLYPLPRDFRFISSPTSFFYPYCCKTVSLALERAVVKVGRYEILDTVGAGAFSRVVRAHDPFIGRIVAIKIFPTEIARGEAREKFFQEARVIGQISHPCILTLHDMGIDEASQTPYLVMEFVEGQPLDRILEKGAVPFPRACAWIGDIAVALGVAHRKGVIHGDVKPANILITAEGRVKLSDFGMARVASRDTGSSPLLGTPAYWCPEQIMGRPQDARSDIFSLGGVLYEMLTGSSPFHAESIQAVCQRVLSSTPLPPSRTNSSVPAALDEIVTKCLMKDPALRLASCDALAEALYPLARRKVIVQPSQPAQQQQTSSLRDRAARLLRSA